jgi:hypothetical protein
MSWDPNAGYDNSGYGNYSDNSSYGVSGYGQQQHSRPASRGARGQASYDMFSTYEPDLAASTASPASQTSAFYNPNEFSFQGQQQQQQQQFQQQQFQQQTSYRRFNLPFLTKFI